MKVKPKRRTSSNQRRRIKCIYYLTTISSPLTKTTMSFQIPPPLPLLTPSTTFVTQHLHNGNIPEQGNLRISALDVPDIITISSIATYAHASSHYKAKYSAIVDALLVPATLGTFTRATIYQQSDQSWEQWPDLFPPTPAEGNRLLCRTYVNGDNFHFTSNEVTMAHRFNPHQFRIILVSHLVSTHMNYSAVGAKLVVVAD